MCVWLGVDRMWHVSRGAHTPPCVTPFVALDGAPSTKGEGWTRGKPERGQGGHLLRCTLDPGWAVW